MLLSRSEHCAELTSRGMRLEFLPPYSPDFNPIELTFSAIKYHLRWHGAALRSLTTRADILCFLWGAVWSITPEDAAGWFHHCSYM